MTTNSVTSLATDGKVLVATVLGSHNLFMFKVKKLQFVVKLKIETQNPMTPDNCNFKSHPEILPNFSLSNVTCCRNLQESPTMKFDSYVRSWPKGRLAQ